MQKKRIIIATLVLASVLTVATVVFAAAPPPPKSFVQGIEMCIATGDCSICDALRVITNVIYWILGTIGAIALFFMVNSGFGMVTSGGNPEKIEAGKKGFVAAVVGLIIVLGAYTFIGILISIFGLTSQQVPAQNTAAGKLWSWAKAPQIQCE